MKVISRYEAELVVQMLSGGQLPEEGNVLIFTRQGWSFISLTGFLQKVSEADSLDEVREAAKSILSEL